MVFAPTSLGFAPGTLIQTPDGHLPIEQIRVGMQVLAQPEAGGERAYRQVLNTVAHLDQEVYAVQVKVAGADSLTTVIATKDHPFWVEAPRVDGTHWMATECLEPGFVLQLADGSKATVHAAGLIRQTQFPEIGFAADERAGVGIVLDLSARQPKLASDAVALKLGRLEVGEAWLTPVYNFEVEEYHTYYVGEVWVHNSVCTPEEATEIADSKTARDSSRPRCFPMDTLVITEQGWIEIDRLGLGHKVLSRCEKTGEQGYRRILKILEDWDGELCEGRIPLYRIDFVTDSGDIDVIEATPEHPFWVNGKGWVNASELQPGQMLEICDPIGIDDCNRPDGQKINDLVLSGQRWQAKIISVAPSQRCNFVYNIEVEDFHTYFVGAHGVWVHNNGECKKEVAIEATLDKAKFEKIEKALEDECFEGDTLVVVQGEDGDWEQREIQWVGYGDMVLSRNEFTGEVGFRKVLEKFKHHDVPVYDLFYYKNVSSGEKRMNFPILVTAGHRFWVEGKGWIALIDLQPGDAISCAYGSVTVEKVDLASFNADVYNLTVEEFHTYFVGDGLWVQSK